MQGRRSTSGGPFSCPRHEEEPIPQPPRQSFDDLVRLMARLRDPRTGCPWDREQTLETLRPYLLEETHELLEALEGGDPAAHCEELGDLLLQIIFQSQLRSEAGQFGIEDVVDGLARKLLRRHPHVFGDEQARDAGQVIATWERVKAGEKGPGGALAGVPRSLPALAGAQKLSERAARVGFDWQHAGQVMDKVREELAELEEALALPEPEPRREAASWELGDLLFALANLARHLNLQAEELLRQANQRFRERFGLVESLCRERGLDIRKASLDELEALWQEAKRFLAKGVSGREPPSGESA
jgi:MazG family protein